MDEKSSGDLTQTESVSHSSGGYCSMKACRESQVIQVYQGLKAASVSMCESVILKSDFYALRFYTFLF